MPEVHYTTKRHYKHLRDKERSQIEILLNEGYTISKIATLLNRHKSTISREIKRGSVL
ncbi:helix-turn-helix domain-containing protein, partial [Granulicatella sp. 19428wC4_WM01]|uniref:helix-turn-helix domain-containing protein n=1 Tax=unclassified Granulicatella TaxID=2630493 RepID=UPI00107353C1